jgi:cation:H+ antiporter
MDLGGLSLGAVAGIFVMAAAIALAGVRLAHVADALADRTGMGEVVAGALFVGAATSLPGAITSISTAAQGASGLAVGNALGGLTAQTAFIAVADLFYRRANLEHAAASVTGLAQRRATGGAAVDPAHRFRRAADHLLGRASRLAADPGGLRSGPAPSCPDA